MKYRNLVVAALISVLSVGCQKENIEEPSGAKASNTTVEHLQISKPRTNEDEWVLQAQIRTSNGSEFLDNGIVDIIDSSTNILLKTVHTNSKGMFETSILTGNYVLECYKESGFIGKSEEIEIVKDSRVEVSL